MHLVYGIYLASIYAYSYSPRLREYVVDNKGNWCNLDAAEQRNLGDALGKVQDGRQHDGLAIMLGLDWIGWAGTRSSTKRCSGISRRASDRKCSPKLSDPDD